MKVGKKFKKGAASFYVVAFSTLILMILATSFVAVIVSEITRTSNDDLSQSAYDSAMAGVEDAKLAFYNYQNCKQKEADGELDDSCEQIMAYMENSEDCDMVEKMLGRGDGGGVVIEEASNVGNNMQQAYTCVKIRNSLGDYRSTLSSANMIDVIKTKFDGVSADKIEKVKISWYRDEGKTLHYSLLGTNNVSFDSASSAPAPPVISLAMMQTAPKFSFADFDTTRGDKTDRGMVYLVPSNNEGSARAGEKTGYIGAYNGSKNVIGATGFLRSNDKTATNPNLPYLVYCDDSGEFMCSATIDIPRPIGDVRNDDTFVFVVGLPYGKPETDFSVEFYCADGAPCVPERYKEEAGSSSQAYMDGVQIQIDSTGRANDLFRRLEVRLKDSSDSVLSIMGPLELLSSNTSMALEKDFRVTKEWNFSN